MIYIYKNNAETKVTSFKSSWNQEISNALGSVQDWSDWISTIRLAVADELNASRNALLCDVVLLFRTPPRTGKAARTWRRFRGSTAFLFLTLTCWSNGNASRKKLKTETTVRSGRCVRDRAISCHYATCVDVQWNKGSCLTWIHLSDTFIQRDLQCIQAIHVSVCVLWDSNPQPFVLLTQCSTTEPQEHENTDIRLTLTLTNTTDLLSDWTIHMLYIKAVTNT